MVRRAFAGWLALDEVALLSLKAIIVTHVYLAVDSRVTRRTRAFDTVHRRGHVSEKADGDVFSRRHLNKKMMFVRETFLVLFFNIKQ